MSKLRLLLLFLAVAIFAVAVFAVRQNPSGKKNVGQDNNEGGLINQQYPLSIEFMRKQEYSGSDIVIEQTLSNGSNYQKYIASYKSEGLKIYGLLTVPIGDPPNTGWPVIIFNHGYIPPEQYQTTERYVDYVDAFAKNGYIVFKPDYRGNGNSEGEPEGAYYSPAYTVDVLNALSSIKKFKDADPGRIGMWGHSLGGNITLRAMVISKDIKAGVIWSGVVGTYNDLLNNWRRKTPWSPSQSEIQEHIGSIRSNLLEKYGTPEDNPSFWHAIDPHYYLIDISGPVQLHQGLADETVPPAFSEGLKNDLENADKTVEYFTYEGADHNLSQPFSLAMARSVEFFDKYVKGAK